MQKPEATIELDAIGTSPEFGVVLIGRNEGERLKRCIESVISSAAQVVYVDSGSSDGSAAWARRRGVEVLELDLKRPFTAARARNEGYRRLLELTPCLPLVQFVDGDCEMAPGWLKTAREFLNSHSDVAAVCGRLRERFPGRSIYNSLCDMEWDAPVGESRAIGGNAMTRCVALSAAGGYREDLIAGEEPELCVRLRAKGWKIWRLGEDMGWHDAGMTRFGQWWTRTVRGGYAYAQAACLHGTALERHGVVETRRAILWGAVLPLLIFGTAAIYPLALALLLVYPMQVLRLALRDGIALATRRRRALFLVLARFPEAQGVLKFWLDRLRRRRSALIEYK